MKDYFEPDKSLAGRIVAAIVLAVGLFMLVGVPIIALVFRK